MSREDAPTWISKAPGSSVHCFVCGLQYWNAESIRAASSTVFDSPGFSSTRLKLFSS